MSPDFETVIYEKKDNIVVITLNRPEKYNALNLQLNQELKNSLKQAKEDNDVRVIIITGAGKAFCAGADVSMFGSKELKAAMAEPHKYMVSPNDFFRLYKPIIAAVNGLAVGEGMNIALVCDFIYASENAFFIEATTNMGLLAEFNAIFTLPKTVGVQRAKELIYTTDRIYANEALRIGLVNKVFPQDELIPKTLETAKKIADKPPLAISYSKEVIQKAYEEVYDNMNKVGQEYQAKLYATEDHLEAAKAFLQKRKPVFKGK